MRKLLNALYVLTPESYLSLDGENVRVTQKGEETGRFPLHILQQISSFSYAGASPALMGKCTEMGIQLSFFTPNGRFLAQVQGAPRGNVLLRRRQYRTADDTEESLLISRNMVFGKVYNARWVIERAIRDHPLSVNIQRLRDSSEILKNAAVKIRACQDAASLRGIEGEAASIYFSVFGELILRNDPAFRFETRNRRPPLDRVNALLSFAYRLLENACASALAGVGLDPYVGMLHTDRAGRESLALDLMEEMRAPLADRFVLSGINNRVFQENMFDETESGAVLLNDNGRRSFLSAWKTRQNEQLTHPFLEERISWGLVPHVQALLLARYLRGDLDAYPAFLWK